MKLKRSQIRTIENAVAFPNGFGYVLDFSDQTFAEFFEDEFAIDIDDISIAGEGSKRTRLTTFLELTDSYTATKVLRALWDRREGLVMRRGNQLDSVEEAATKNRFLEIIRQVEDNSDNPSSDGIDLYARDRTLEKLIADIERSLSVNKPEVAMDHLHTYCMKKFAHLLSVRGIKCDQDEALLARVGKYRKAIVSELGLSEFTDRALKMTISLFDAFNEIRNNRSLAHDNQILEPSEARYIFLRTFVLLYDSYVLLRRADMKTKDFPFQRV